MEKFELPQIEISEKTPLVEQLLSIIEKQKSYLGKYDEEIQKLKEEINRLKKHKGKPNIKPSSLEKSRSGNVNDQESKKRKNKQEKPSTGSKKPDRIECIKVDGLPEDAIFKGYRYYYVQDLIIKKELTEYRLERYELPDGGFVVAQLPKFLKGSHFGPTLQAYVLHQHHHQGVTHQLILKQLRELGFGISAGELNRILTEGKDRFHEEKAKILSAGLEVSNHIHVDDTGARHDGKNGYCTHIGNDLFAWFESTKSKSRLNFLSLLRQNHCDYILNEESFEYMEKQKLAPYLREELREGPKEFQDEDAWKNHLKSLGIEGERHIRIATEAALMGSVLRHGFSMQTVIVSDDAGQFNVFRHALCWIHAERNINKLVPMGDHQANALKFVRSSFWFLYQDIKAYCADPTEALKAKLEKDFDVLSHQITDFQLLNLQLKRMKANKSELLLVLERPDIPLHNNLSERDIREYVKRRKISGGTRSDEGKKCRDTFASLKKTAIKLKVGFWGYLIDRLQYLQKIPPLPDLIKQQAFAKNST